jgi:hypothetical protein
MVGPDERGGCLYFDYDGIVDDEIHLVQRHLHTVI